MNLNATLLAQLVVFFILAWFTMRFVWPPIMSALNERTRKIAEGLEASEKSKSQLLQTENKVKEEMLLLSEKVKQKISPMYICKTFFFLSIYTIKCKHISYIFFK